MSKIFQMSVIVVVLLAMLLGGCQPAPTPTAAPVVVATEAPVAPPAEVAVTNHFKFAWIMPDMFNPFWVYMRQGAEKAAQELRKEGIQVDIQQMAPIQTFNVEEQVAIFENAITMKVDAIGICVIDQNAVIEQVNKAEAAGIPVAALSTDIPNSNRSVFAGQDNKVVAQKAAEMAIQKNGGKGNYIILSGIAGNYISEERDAGYKAAIDAAGTTLLDKQPSNFNRKDGMAVMENMLQKYGAGEIQGVFTVNDEAALGAHRRAHRMELLRGDRLRVPGQRDGHLRGDPADADRAGGLDGRRVRAGGGTDRPADAGAGCAGGVVGIRQEKGGKLKVKG